MSFLAFLGIGLGLLFSLAIYAMATPMNQQNSEQLNTRFKKKLNRTRAT